MGFLVYMPRYNLTKEEIRAFVLEQKIKLDQEYVEYTPDPKSLAHKYINNILNKIEEYRY